MAALEPNDTARVKIFYQNAIASHVANARYDQDGSIQAVTDIFKDVTTELTAQFAFHEVTAVQAAAINSDIFLDVPGSDLVGYTFGSTPANAEINSVQCRFQGRTSAGRRVSMTVFGWKGITSNFRITPAELEEVGAAVEILQADDGAWIAIDGNAPTWKLYVNIKPNDHWVKEARNG